MTGYQFIAQWVASVARLYLQWESFNCWFMIYDLHAQLKPHPKPTKVTHYCTQLTCICIPMSGSQAGAHTIFQIIVGNATQQRGKQRRFSTDSDSDANTNTKRQWQWQLVKLVVLSIALFSNVSLESHLDSSLSSILPQSPFQNPWLQ